MGTATEIAAFDPRKVQEFEDGPYYMVPGRGLAIKDNEEPTEDQAEEMLAFIDEWDQFGALIAAHFLATLPTRYGRTLNKAMALFGKRWGEKRVWALRGFGVKCPAHLVIRGVSLSHHMTLYWDYKLSQEQRDDWMEKLLESADQPGANGRMWSVNDLREKVRKQLGLPSGKPPSLTDSSHELAVENDKLKTDLWNAESGLVLIEKIITENVIPHLEDSGDDASLSAVETLRDMIEERSSAVPGEPTWYFKPNDDGRGGELMWKEVIPSGVPVFTYIHENDLPVEARKDLIKKLNAQIA